MKFWQFLIILVLAFLSIGFGKRETLMMNVLALGAEKTTLENHKKFIGESIEIRLPENGTAPFPVLLQFHGCAGIREPFQHQWADIANEAGFAAMIVDSMAPRGISREEALETVCNGKELLGQERAADVLAAVKLAEDDPRLDTTAMVFAAWSHGAWTVMDYLTMDLKKRRPAGILDDEIVAPEPVGAVIFYPYCGLGTYSRFRAWRQKPDVLAFLAGKDELVDAEACKKIFDRRIHFNHPLEYVFYADAHHVFDDPFLEPEWIHWYNEEYFKDAKTRFEEFLASAAAQ